MAYQFSNFSRAIVPPDGPEDPNVVMGRALTLRNVMQQRELGDMELTARRQAAADEAELRSAFNDAGGDPVKLRDALSRTQKGMGILAGMDKSRLDQKKTEGDIAKTATETRGLDLVQAKTKIDELASASGSLIRLTPEQRATAWPTARAALIGRKLATAEELPEVYPGDAWLQQQHASGLSAQQQLDAHLKDAEEVRKQELHGPAVEAATADAEQKRILTDQYGEHGMTLKDVEANKIVKDGQVETGRHNLVSEKESGRHNRAVEATAAAGVDGATDLSPEALGKMAEYFATTGLLPPLGQGKQATAQRAQIINLAAKEYPSVTVASSGAAYMANRKSLSNVTAMLDNVESFEKTTAQSLKLFTAAAGKMRDTGMPWLNTPLRLLDEKLVGDENIAVVNAARQVALTEIAKVITDPKMQGVLSDSARHEISSLSGRDATLPQILSVAKLLQTEMKNRHQSLIEQKQAIEGRIGAPVGASAAAGGGAPAGGSRPAGLPPGVPAAGGAVTVRDPAGNIHTFRDQAGADAFKRAAGIN
jgi:hypothetical protein